MKRGEALKKAQSIEADVEGIYSMVTMLKDSIWFARHLRECCDLLSAGGPLPSCDPILIFDADFSENKMKFAIFKGEAQFEMKKRLGNYSFLVLKLFEQLTDFMFRLMK